MDLLKMLGNQLQRRMEVESVIRTYFNSDIVLMTIQIHLQNVLRLNSPTLRAHSLNHTHLIARFPKTDSWDHSRAADIPKNCPQLLEIY